MGIKKFIFGEEDVTEKAERIIKNKKISLLEKYMQIKKLYLKYFSYDLYRNTKTSLYEKHYEDFMKNGVIQSNNYYKYYNEELQNSAFFSAFVLCRQFDELVKQGLNPKFLKSSNEEFAVDVFKLKKECGFNKYFNGDEFYYNKSIHDNISNKIDIFIQKCKEQYKSEMEYVL